jgi:hypothetical protein
MKKALCSLAIVAACSFVASAQQTTTKQTTTTKADATGVTQKTQTSVTKKHKHHTAPVKNVHKTTTTETKTMTPAK